MMAKPRLNSHSTHNPVLIACSILYLELPHTILYICTTIHRFLISPSVPASLGTCFPSGASCGKNGRAGLMLLRKMYIEVPKAMSCEMPRASKVWVLGRDCTPRQSIRGSGERHKLPQRGPGRSTGSLRIFYVSSSTLCLKFKFNSQFDIIRGINRQIYL